MKTLSKVVTFQKWKDLCTLNQISSDDNLNPVLYVPAAVELLRLTATDFES